MVDDDCRRKLSGGGVYESQRAVRPCSGSLGIFVLCRVDVRWYGDIRVDCQQVSRPRACCFCCSHRCRLRMKALLQLLVATFCVGEVAGQVGPVPEAVRQKFKLAPFYQKYVNVDGFPIVSSSNVSDYALLEASWIVRQMLTNRGDILAAMGSNNVRLAVMAWNEFTTDIPEHSDLKSAVYWDRRARGLGATRVRPAVSCAEENLLC